MRLLTIILILASFTACATTQHPPMKGVFTPHFKKARGNV